MAGRIVTLKMTETELEILDALTAIRGCMSRSDCLRQMVRSAAVMSSGVRPLMDQAGAERECITPRRHDRAMRQFLRSVTQ